MHKLLFVDLDGTIRKPITGEWVQPWDNQEPIPGAKDAITRYANDGWYVIGVTNQGGVAAGKKTIEDCIKEQQFTSIKLFPELGFICFCPDFEGNELYCIEQNEKVRKFYRNSKNYNSFRKPGTGMIEFAIVEYCYGFNNLLQGEIDEMLMIGDRTEDEQCAKSANIDFMWAKDFIK